MPICTPDGYFAKLQKNTENSYQFCSDREGDVIDSFENIDQNSPQGKSMNCECATARKYLSDISRKPKCCKNGNFQVIIQSNSILNNRFDNDSYSID